MTLLKVWASPAFCLASPPAHKTGKKNYVDSKLQ